jgi:hypothetical protein
MNSSINIFDENNNLSDDFNETVELVLMGIHGDKYYDVDEDLQDTRLLKTIKDEDVKPKKVSNKNEKVTFKDFIPVLFFIIITIILCFGGYYFLKGFDITNLFGA